MKTCFKCGESKSRDEFYDHPQMADGKLGKCKQCTKNDTATRHALKSGDPHWLVSELARHRKKSQKYRADGREKKHGPEGHEKWCAKNPTKRQAHHAVNNAVRDGKLAKQPCEVCGSKNVHGHHDDYSKPLDVRWLCPKHHGEHHHNLTIQKLLNGASAGH